MVSLRSCLVLILSVLPVFGAMDRPLVEKWLQHQTSLKSWSADLVQVRKLKSLSKPLTTPGKVLFMQPKFFRWELGDPPQTIAIRQPENVLLIYPRLKRVEKYDFKKGGPWQQALTLLEAGFPTSLGEIESKFKILNGESIDSVYVISLEPKQGKNMIPKIQIGFNTSTLSLAFTELSLADGSTLRNEFSKPEVNPGIGEEFFNPEIPEDFKVIEGYQPNAK